MTRAPVLIANYLIKALQKLLLMLYRKLHQTLAESAVLFSRNYLGCFAKAEVLVASLS
jgi:hypothetical protein